MGSLNTLGGTAEEARNLVSGNNNFGVSISPGAAGGNRVQGNFIGTDVDGNARIPNGSGIRVRTKPPARLDARRWHGTRGREPRRGKRNGIALGGTLIGNLIQGNFIGTDVNGTLDVGNTGDGVFITFGSCCNTIGGTAATAGNVISGNDGNGIRSQYHTERDPGEPHRHASGRCGALGNGSHGMFVNFAAGHTIGGTTPGEEHDRLQRRRRRVRHRRPREGFAELHLHNAGLGSISIPTASRPTTPEMPTAAPTGCRTSLCSLGDHASGRHERRGTLNSRPMPRSPSSSSSSPPCDPSGHGEGRTLLGSTTVNTDGGGNGDVLGERAGGCRAGSRPSPPPRGMLPGTRPSSGRAPRRLLLHAAERSAGIEVEPARIVWTAPPDASATTSWAAASRPSARAEATSRRRPAPVTPTTWRRPSGARSTAPARAGIWFLVRAVNCAGNGTYDGGRLPDRAARCRDRSLPAACP